ncbi:MAG TPA: diphthine synthase [Nitrososphaera sp.]|jgi:diphthine synthase|nr:diphthine synthase [Nitrososphaera sp.]
MLWFVGMGLGGYRGVSVQAIDVLKKCDIVYFERFTSDVADSDVKGLNQLTGKDLKEAQRWFIEDGREIMDLAKAQDVAIVTYGDPLIATTHSELRARAARKSIKTSVLHSASGIYSSVTESGLHVYKLGKTVTIMSEPQSAISVYNTIYDNLISGNHTLILTEYRSRDSGQPFFLSPCAVFGALQQVERDLRHGAFSTETFAIVASRIGEVEQTIISGKVGSLLRVEFGKGPHSIIIPGTLHFTESEAIESLTVCHDNAGDNSKGIARISSQMIQSYAPKARQAVQHMRDFLQTQEGIEGKKGLFEVLDNAENYISDSERFLNQGKPELAVLSIGYAEGLVDALRFQKGINPWLPPG